MELGGEQRKLYFNLNTFAAFEELRDKRFFEFLQPLEEALSSKAGAAAIAAAVSFADIRAVIWAALHEYNMEDEPVWPLNLFQAGRLVDMSNLHEVLPQLLAGARENMPSEDEVDPTQEETGASEPSPSPPDNGGDLSGLSGEEPSVSAIPKLVS
jgi:hypothetical protein